MGVDTDTGTDTGLIAERSEANDCVPFEILLCIYFDNGNCKVSPCCTVRSLHLSSMGGVGRGGSDTARGPAARFSILLRGVAPMAVEQSPSS